MNATRVLRLPILAAFAVVCTACGGGGGGSGSPEVDLGSDAALDGFADSDGGVVTDGGGTLVGDLEDLYPGRGYREFFSFSLAGIPPGATIESAVLRLHQENFAGSPFATLGLVVVDHMDYGGLLDAGDYAAPALSADIGTISSDDADEIKTLDVTTQVLADVAAPRTRSQFRLRFDVLDFDDDGSPDYVQFTDSSNQISGTGTLPVLRVTYSLP